MTATAHLLHGFMGAGKTTFARRLERDRRAVRFTHDDWMARLNGADPPPERFAEYAARISALMEDVWRRCLSVGTDIVLDTGHWTRAERDAARAAVAAEGAEAVLYRLRCDDATALARIARRSAAGAGGVHVAAETYWVRKPMFEPLGEDEARVEVGDDPEDRFVGSRT